MYSCLYKLIRFLRSLDPEYLESSIGARAKWGHEQIEQLGIAFTLSDIVSIMRSSLEENILMR